MSNWARRMHRRAATLSNVVTSCGHPNSLPYPRRLEKVKFGAPLSEVCKDDIPGPLLVLILKLNKEAPLRRDVFRAPGHQGAMKKLIHFLQTGRLVNVDNYSVYTIASVLKKFLRKIPGGVFGRDGEMHLFAAVELPSEQQVDAIRRLLLSLPVCTQRLLVLLFGTFRVMASNADKAGTGMTSEALGVSVAPSFFHSCVSDGKTATMEDVQRFKVATRIMRQLIEQFSAGDLFGRDNYEYYARVTGRVLRVRDEWICSFRDPPPPRHHRDQEAYARQLSLEAEKTWLQCECDRWGNKFKMEGLSKSEECQSMPLLAGGAGGAGAGAGLGIIPEHSLLDSCTRLSISLEESIFKVSVSSSSQSSRSSSSPHMTLEELRAINKYAESTKSLSYLPQVATRIMRQLIEQFSAGDLFGRDNYEYYARVTGRVLRVRDEWICSFRDPPPPRHHRDQEAYARQLSLEAEKTWLQCECDRWGNKFKMEGLSKSEECQSMPLLAGGAGGAGAGAGLGIIPEHSLLDSCTRLSISLEESIFKVSVSSSSQSSRSSSSPHMTLEELRAINKYAESTKSLSYLPQAGLVVGRGAHACAAPTRTPTLRCRSLSSLVK